MGRHKDPQTLAFIDKLMKKGVSLGYVVRDEYVMFNGLYQADLVWKLADDQPPLITFEVETEDSARIFKNISKYFDTLAENVPKPYRHFLIVIRGSLSDGNRFPLQRYINQYNVSLFEDVANNKETENLLFQQLGNMKLQIKDLVKRYISTGQVDEAIVSLLAGIREGMPRTVIDAKSVEVSIRSEERKDPSRPHEIRISMEHAAGRPSLLQRLDEAARTGKEITLTKEDRIQAELPGLGKVEPEWIIAKYERTPGLAIRLETPDSPNSVELILAIRDETAEELILTNERQDVPYQFEFHVNKKSGEIRMTSMFDIKRASPYQAITFFDFLAQTKKNNRLVIRAIEDNRILIDTPVPESQACPLPDDVLQALRILAEIEQRTGVTLPFPTRINEEEARLIERVYQIITTGIEQATAKSLPVSFTKDQAKRRLFLAKNPDVLLDFRLSQTEFSPTLFGKAVPLGPSTITVREARMDLRQLESELDRGTDPVRVEVSVTSDKPLTVSYTNWWKQESPPKETKN